MRKSPRRAILTTALFALCVAMTVAPARAVALPATSHGLVPRIIGGQPSAISENPWQVLLVMNDRTQCGGSLITSSWILTAAHCVTGVDAAAVKVWAGISALSERSEQNRLPASRVIVHPGYSGATYANDLALIELASPLAPSATLAPIRLPVAQDPAVWPVVGTAATVSGWGYLGAKGPAASALYRATVHVLSPPEGPCGRYGAAYLPGYTLCVGEAAGGVDTCQGDSGGPLVVAVDGRPVLAGVTSAGNECALADYPGLYTRVTSHLAWIRDTAGIPLVPPAPPDAVTAVGIAQGRAVVKWSSPGATSFTVTAAPGAVTCETSDLTCVVAGLTPGTAYSFTVQAENSAGTSATSTASPPIVAVNGTSTVGRTIKERTAFRWAGVKQRSNSTLRSLTPALCRAVALGVKITRAGICKVSVRSGTKSTALFIASGS